MRLSEMFVRENDSAVQCTLCNHRCHIQEGKRGICGVRENRNGELYSLVYGKLVAQNVDPVEKKPLFHFLPGSTTYSISTVGCNFQCLHCQNYHISQFPHMHNGEISGVHATPGEVVGKAQVHGCKSISYTYVEPTIFYEFSRDCGELAHQHGLKNIYVSNGYMTVEALEKMVPWMDAINVDIKAFDDQVYRKVCKARLQPVLDNVRLLHQYGVWLEVTTLVIPGINDSQQQLEGIANFIADIDCAIPWHVTAFYPTYKMTDRQRTPLSSLEKAFAIGKSAGLQYVYQGNIPGEKEDTECPSCGAKVLSRSGFVLNFSGLENGSCVKCGFRIPGIF
ncbi:AmmeMemoRadiSam system radical SAM enzyme [Desulfogranum japonicum]|uniref:AmmeMemoRadiSam system radical SAM enzyme n=1 Tax=Desulfogranum japonicum TaxID=231447 RepID=UPI0004904370|nr:AmmeMemoRadiSam system radical SAM enzyme [Desulfogranum japonicum]